MPETTNLKLYKKDPIAEKKTTFNIETMLNENWDKIDQAFGGIENALENIITYKDILNLSATPAGVITWALPTATDGTRTAIVLCRATKDISNMDYVACLADATITKNTLAQSATTNTYSGLTNSTQYWVKAFVKYAIGGKEFYSGGVTVTFTTPSIQEISNLWVNLSTGTITWTLPSGSSHTNVEVCYSKTNISGYTYAQCQADSNVTKAELTSTATSYTVNVLDKTTYYVKVFLKYSGTYSNGVATNWLNPKQWYYKAGEENVAVTGGWVAGFTQGTPTRTKESINLRIDASDFSVGEYVTNNIINLSGIKKLYIEWSLDVSAFQRQAHLKLGMSKTDGLAELGSSMVTGPFGKMISSFDSTNVNSAYIKACNETRDGGTGYLKVYRVWGES